ncbi:mitochondrial import inner membrane translocase subunit Tim10 B [Zophobas morio]|uniref:mitochondrial import inner membrane translocase subunit Tim10 B n=1 Tax=Zophobas morio TaxID=2755281 RepID=UPI00308318CD
MNLDASGLRNFKDFLQLYNQMTERCFYRCIENTNSRHLTPSEIECSEECATKFIKFNNKLMMNFVNRQNDIMSRRIKEAEQMAENNQAVTVPSS